MHLRVNEPGGAHEALGLRRQVVIVTDVARPGLGRPVGAPVPRRTRTTGVVRDGVVRVNCTKRAVVPSVAVPARLCKALNLAVLTWITLCTFILYYYFINYKKYLFLWVRSSRRKPLTFYRSGWSRCPFHKVARSEYPRDNRSLLNTNRCNLSYKSFFYKRK